MDEEPFISVLISRLRSDKDLCETNSVKVYLFPLVMILSESEITDTNHQENRSIGGEWSDLRMRLGGYSGEVKEAMMRNRT